MSEKAPNKDDSEEESFIKKNKGKKTRRVKKSKGNSTTKLLYSYPLGPKFKKGPHRRK